MSWLGEKENWHTGTAALPYGPIPRIQAHTARTKKQLSTYACAQTFTIVAKDDNQKEN